LGLKDNKDSILFDLTNEGEKEITLPMIVKSINSADKYTLKVIENAARAYAVAINNIAILLDLKCIIIGGALIDLGIAFLNKISEIINKKSPIEVKVFPSGLRENASLYGTYIIGNYYLTKNMIK